MSGDSTRNIVHGDTGPVIQAGTVHLHSRPAPATPRQLPPAVTHFTGRSAELDLLDTLITSEARAVVISAIAGAAGIGKTSLAVHWAHRVRHQFPDGQLSVNLRGFSPEPPLSPVQVLTGFLLALGVPGAAVPQDLDTMTGLYRSLLADRRVLVLLDNAADADQVRPLLPSSLTCVVLVTSRNRLPGLVARDGAHRITLEELSPLDATALLRDVIGPVRADAEKEATGHLARRCSGLPLALRIAAERVADRPHRRIADLTADLEDRRLDALSVEGDTMADIRAVFAWSYNALPPLAARAFRLLGLHPGPTISTHAAAALTGLRVAAVRPVLNTLTAGHLLLEIGNDRFQFHDLVREYAAETSARHESDEESADCLHRLLTWYLDTADSARLTGYPHHGTPRLEHLESEAEGLHFESRSDALEWCRQEHVNLLSALHLAAERELHRIAALLPVCLASHYIRTGQRTADIEACTIGVASARALGDDNIEILALSCLSDALLRANRFDESLHHSHHMLELASRTGLRRKVAGAHHVIGLCLQRQGHFDIAAEHFRTALPIYRELGISRGEAIMLGELGEVCRRQHRFASALDYLNRSLSILRASGNSWNEALYLRHVSLLAIDLGHVDEAIEHLRRSANIYLELEDPFEAARTLRMLGDVLNSQGEENRAVQAWSDALAIYESLHTPEAAELRKTLALAGQ